MIEGFFGLFGVIRVVSVVISWSFIYYTLYREWWWFSPVARSKRIGDD